MDLGGAAHDGISHHEVSDSTLHNSIKMPPPPQSCGKMKVVELRSALELRGLPTEGLKAALVARLEESLASGTSVADTADDAPVIGQERVTTAGADSTTPANMATPVDMRESSNPAATGAAEPSDEDDDDELGAIMRAGSEEVEEEEERTNASASVPQKRNLESSAEAAPDATEPESGAPPLMGTPTDATRAQASPPIAAASKVSSAELNESAKKSSTNDDAGKGPPIKRTKAQEATASLSTKTHGASSGVDISTDKGSASTGSPKSAMTSKAGTGGSTGSASLRVENFLRPFTAKAAREMVESAGGGACTLKAGEEGFWMDTIKTTAVATFDDDNEGSGTGRAAAAAAALAAVNAINGSVWPPEHGRVLTAKLSPTPASAMHSGQAQEHRLRQEAMLALRNRGAAKNANTAGAVASSTTKATGLGAAPAIGAAAAGRPIGGLAASRLGAPPGGAAATASSMERTKSTRSGTATGDDQSELYSSSNGRVLKKGRGMHLAQYDGLRPHLQSSSTTSSSKLVTIDDVFLRTEVCIINEKFRTRCLQLQLASRLNRSDLLSCAISLPLFFSLL